MAKRLFLLLIISLIGVVAAPDFLTADDHFTAKSPEFNDVLTVEIQPEETTPEVVALATYSEPAVDHSAPVVYSEPVYVAPQIVNYTVSYYIGSVAEYTDTAYNLRYDGLYKFRKMIYGHNSYNLLGNLSSRYVGETFTITEGGVARSYVVTGVQTYEKTSDGNLNWDAGLMSRIATSALGNDIALLTCAGVSFGNGDASHRLVVFANAI